MMPLTNSAARPAPERKASTRPGSVPCAQTNVLVVDDDRSFRLLARSLLDPSGVRIAEAETGYNGLAYLKVHAREVDAVIMDLYLRVSAFLGADAVLPKSRIELLSSLLGEVLR